MTLREAAARSSANVAAVIVDVKGMRTTPTGTVARASRRPPAAWPAWPRTTSTIVTDKEPGDRSLTIVIADPSSHTAGNASEDMVVTLFRKTEAPLAQLQVGMPILFRALKVGCQAVPPCRRYWSCQTCQMPRATPCRVPCAAWRPFRWSRVSSAS